MKKIFILLISTIILGTTLSGCEKMLDVTPESEFAPDNVLTSEAGIKALLFSSYGNFINLPITREIINISEVTTDMALNSGGNENLYLTQFMNFAWDASTSQLQTTIWGPYYRVIRDANFVLENIDNVQTTDEVKLLYASEARFLRAYAYAYLYSWYGPVPLRTSNIQPQNLPRATEQEMKDFIESELRAVVPGLPDPGKEEAFGRATKGAALATLTKFCLNTKQWQKAADAAQDVIDLHYYELYPVFKDMFKVEHEGNKEMIFVMSAINQDAVGNWFAAGSMPPAFSYTDQLPEYKWTSNIQNFATQYRLRDAFVSTFNPADERYVLVVRNYVNTSGNAVNLQATANNTRSLKFFDNAAVKNDHGNDLPIYRYSDILLSRAEALNELNGVNTDALDLLNEVHERAGLTAMELTDFPSKDSFKEAIFKERGWEFISEGKRREDLIRQGVFVSKATARGVTNAKDIHVVFPIPQVEMDANTAMVQNTGY